MFRRTPPEVFFKKYTPQTRRKRSQQSHFATLLKSDSCTDAPARIRSTPAEQLFPGEHLWETASVCQKSFKRFKL